MINICYTLLMGQVYFLGKIVFLFFSCKTVHVKRQLSLMKIKAVNISVWPQSVTSTKDILYKKYTFLTKPWKFSFFFSTRVTVGIFCSFQFGARFYRDKEQTRKSLSQHPAWCVSNNYTGTTTLLLNKKKILSRFMSLC